MSEMDALRGQVRRARVAAMGALVVALVLPLLALGPGASLLRADRVEAREIDLVDASGNVVVRLRGEAGGSIAFVRPDGDVAFALGERSGSRRFVHVGDAGMRGWGVLGELDPEDRAVHTERALDGVHASPERVSSERSPEDVALRVYDGATSAERALARELVSRGWVYVMPKPKSASARWGYTHGGTTWFNGYWTNERTGRVSSVQPSASDGFAGDGIEVEEWRRGGSPDAPSVVEWLCSKEGGIEPESE